MSTYTVELTDLDDGTCCAEVAGAVAHGDCWLEAMVRAVAIAQSASPSCHRLVRREADVDGVKRTLRDIERED